MSDDSWRTLVDCARLAGWMDGQGLEQGPIEDARPLTGGTQNLLLLFRRGKRRFVLRRPPPHPRTDGTETMRREARVLAALGNTAVPHPRLIAACDDKSVLGAGFFLMEPVDGFTATVGLPEPHASKPDWRHRMGLSMVEAIAQLGQVDYVAAGLGEFSKLDNYLGRQAGRWRAQLEGYRQYPGWPGPSILPGVDEVSAWLGANCPATFRPGIVHGDFHLSNVMFRTDAPELAAVVDWELASIGEPLMDLGWLLATWPDENGRNVAPTLEVGPWEGFAGPGELAAHYAQCSGRDLRDLDWYVVLACYKLGILLEGTHARACAGKASKNVGDSLHAATLNLFARARSRIARAGQLPEPA